MDAALASSKEASDTLDRQLKEQAVEAQRVRTGLEDEVRRLTVLLGQATAIQEQVRREHSEIVAAKDQDLRQALERHAGQEKHMLAEVDRARQTARALKIDLAKEQQRRVKFEESVAKRLEVELGKQAELREASRESKARLANQISTQRAELAQSHSATQSARAQIEALARRIEEERSAHEKTRDMLSASLTRKRLPGRPPQTPSGLLPDYAKATRFKGLPLRQRVRWSQLTVERG